MKHPFVLSRTFVAISLAICSGVSTAAEDETIVVVGTHVESAVGPDFSYVGEVSRTATKTELELGKTPRSISVVTREQLDDRASISIADALKYTPSIQANYYGEDNKQDWFVIRGFEQASNGLYQDGTRLYSSGFYSWQIDPYGLERVEILRGPASSLYGQTPPGGLINVVSKRPQFDGGSGQVSVEYGTDDRKQISLDVNHEINQELAFRLVGLARKSGTRIDNVEAERLFIAPSLAWNISDKSKLTLLTSYQNDESDPYLQFLPVEGVLTNNANGKISDDTAVGNPDWEHFKREQISLGYEFEHQLASNTQFVQSARYSQMELDLRQMYTLFYAEDTPLVGPVLDPTGERTDIVRGASVEKGESDSFNIDNRVVHKLRLGDAEHTLMFGLDYQQLDINSQSYAGNPVVTDGNNFVNIPGIGFIPDPNFNVFQPSYSNNVVLLDLASQQILTEADLETTVTDNKQLGIYFQDQMLLASDWAIQFGARYDDTSNRVTNTTTGASTKVDADEWTVSSGVAYLSDNGLTPYISYAQSFNPIIRVDSNGNQAKPEYSELFEVGIKYTPKHFDGYFNIAAFEVTKENVAQTTSGVDFVQLGEVTNTGVEFEAVANITNAFTLLGNAAFIDSEVTGDRNASVVGKTTPQVADLLASIWGNYKFFGGNLDGLSVGAGVRYTGSAYADNQETLEIPSFTLVDATISYRIDDYKLQVAAKNLFDKKYIATCNTSNCWYGDRQNFIASLSYDW